MAAPDHGSRFLTSRARGDWVRLRTLIVLRWIAITGQILAITLAARGFGLRLDLGLCFIVIGAAVVANLVAIFVFPQTKRLSESQAMLTQLFDIVQISCLLYLTGGLNNPFALLIIAPVTISATALGPRSTAFLGVVAAGFLTLLAFFHQPLVLASGAALTLPAIYLFGFWAAIVIGIAFLAAYAHRITEETHSMADALAATQMALAREQKLTDLGGVVAAAAHELGTPLATIKLVSAELMEELADRADLAEDAGLILEQADRCRDVLRSMGRAGKDDLQMRSAPLSALLREAAEPHMDRGKTIHFELMPEPEGGAKDGGAENGGAENGGAENGDGDGARQPLVLRRPEVIHGLRNLIQNAVDFATGRVWISARWTASSVTVRIVDDGPGFPPQLFARIGDPFVRRRGDARADDPRQGYEGMGLGLFIAKTLLERTGARLDFANGSDPFLTAAERPERGGAIVEVSWPRERIALDESAAKGGLGENLPIET